MTENIEDAILFYQQTLESCARDTDPQFWASIQHRLGVAYMNRQKGSRTENMRCAIHAYSQALSVRNPEAMPLDWAQTMVNKAFALSQGAEGEGGVEQAISLLTEVLEFLRQREISQPLMGTALVTLADVYLCHNIPRLSYQQSQERAIQLLEEALKIQQNLPEKYAAVARKLGVTYVSRRAGKSDENIQQAIALFRNALQVYTRRDFPDEWAETTMQMAIAFCAEDWDGSQAQNVEQAIELFKQVLELKRPENDLLGWAETQSNMASAYQKRVRGSRAENTQEAISLYEQVLRYLPKDSDPLMWASIQANLGLSYQQWHLGNSTEDLDRAIAAYEQSLQVRTRDAMPQEWAITAFNLISCLMIYPRKNDVQHLDRMISLLQRVLGELSLETSLIHWVQVQEMLALAYLDLPDSRAENVERAISAIERVLEVLPIKQFPIDYAAAQAIQGAAYDQRIQGELSSNLQIAESAYRQALAVFTPDTIPHNCRQTAAALGMLLFKQNRWADAVSPYRTALQAMDCLYRSSLQRTSREAELSQMPSLAAHAAYAMARCGLMRDAVVAVEYGRARELSYVLARDRADMERIHAEAPDLYDAYQQAIAHLRSLEELASQQDLLTSPSEQLIQAEDWREAHAGLSSVLEGIRCLSGHADFQLELGFEGIAEAVLPSQPLIYLVVTAVGGLALCLHRARPDEAVSVEAIWLDGLSETVLKDLLAGSASAPPFGGWLGAYLNMRKDLKTWFDTLERTTRQLWELIMGPILKRLHIWGTDEAVLIAGGLLGLLPLHAAWEGNETQRTYALDRVAFRSAPSARVLTQARRLAATTAEAQILLVEEPRPVSARPLPSAHAEAQAITALFPPPPRVFRHEGATRPAVLESMGSAHIAYFICHGFTDWVNPLQSGLQLSHDQRLTAQDFLNLRLSGARLAVLSACETGVISAHLPDEVVSLSAALLQAGFAGVATSLWPVEDLSTALLMEHLMRAWRVNGLHPAKALRHAQIWLRDTTLEDKKNYLQQFLSGSLATSASPLPMPEEAASIFLKLLVSQEFNRTFEHPFFWAAFTYVGA